MKTKMFGMALVLFLVLPLAQTSAQQKQGRNERTRFGLLGGVNLQDLYGTKYDGGVLGYKLIIGYHAGVNAIIPVGTDIFFMPGVIFSAKGAKQEILSNTIRTTNLSYLEIPLNFLYRPQLGDGHILLGAGPYFAYGITGSQTEKLDGEASVKRTIRFKNSTDTDYAYYKPLDFGGNIFLGYEFYNGIFCQLNTQMGLYKINPDFEISDDKTSKKNIGFGLSAGYRF